MNVIKTCLWLPFISISGMSVESKYFIIVLFGKH